MPDRLHITSLGCQWVVDVSRLDDAVATRLAELWAHTAGIDPGADCPPDGPFRTTAIHVEHAHGGAGDLPDPLTLSRDPTHAPYSFSGAITLRSIQKQSGRLTMLHSAALALPQTGATVLLIAESGTGKTTATRVLGRTLGYLSDETAAIREDLTLVPHPKPLSIIATPGGPKLEESPAELGLLPAPADPWLAAAIFLDRDRSAHGPAQLSPMPLLEAMVQAIPQSSGLPTQEQPLLRLARVLTAGGGSYRLRYSEIADAASIVADLLASVTRGQSAPQDWTMHSPPASRRTQPWAATSGQELSVTSQVRVRRAPWRDAIEHDGEVLVLNGPRPVLLSGLGATIWLAGDRAVSVAGLLDEVLAVHGEHPRAAELVAEAVQALAAEGIMEAAPSP